MLKDCMEIFQECAKEKNKTPEDLILETYVPSIGDYIFVDENGGYRIAHVSYSIKEGKKVPNAVWIFRNDSSRKNFITVLAKEDLVDAELKTLKFCDYYSRILDTNKNVGSDSLKKIVTNNYLSFGCKWEKVKKETEAQEEKKDKVTEETFDLYFSMLIKNFFHKKEGISNKETADELRNFDWLKNNYDDLPDDLQRNWDWLKNNFQAVANKINEWKSKENNPEDNNKQQKTKTEGYIKFFFLQKNMEKFRCENKRYLNTRLFGDSKNFITDKDGKKCGIPANNFTLSDKKIFFKNLTRCTTFPQVVSFEDAYNQKLLFDYLYNQASQYNGTKAAVYFTKNPCNIIVQAPNDPLHVSFSGVYLLVNKGMKEAEILDYDVISYYKTTMEPHFFYNNHLKISPEKISDNKMYKEYAKKSDIVALIDRVIFKNELRRNFFTESKKVCNDNKLLQRNILSSREAIYSWLYKGTDPGVRPILHKICSDNVKDAILKGHFLGDSGAINQFNMMLSLEQFFTEKIEKTKTTGENIMEKEVRPNVEKSTENELSKSQQLYDSLKEKIMKYEAAKDEKDKMNIKISNDEEYFYAVGQLAWYFISLNKSKNKPHSLMNPILYPTSDHMIKSQLSAWFMKYNYAISTNNHGFNALYKMVKDYTVKGNVITDNIEAGYMSSCLVWEILKEKKKEREEREERDKNTNSDEEDN